MISIVLDADIIIARYQRCVSNFVALFNLRAVHRNFAWPVHRYAQHTTSGVARVNDKVCLLASFDLFQAIPVSVQSGWIGVHFADFDTIRATLYVNPVELHMDVVNAVLPWHESHRVSVGVDALDEAVILDTTGRYNLRNKKEISLVRVSVVTLQNI